MVIVIPEHCVGLASTCHAVDETGAVEAIEERGFDIGLHDSSEDTLVG